MNGMTSVVDSPADDSVLTLASSAFGRSKPAAKKPATAPKEELSSDEVDLDDDLDIVEPGACAHFPACWSQRRGRTRRLAYI